MQPKEFFMVGKLNEIILGIIWKIKYLIIDMKRILMAVVTNLGWDVLILPYFKTFGKVRKAEAVTLEIKY